MRKLCQPLVLSLMLFLIENSIKKKLQSKMCFSRCDGTVSYFKQVNKQREMQILLSLLIMLGKHMNASLPRYQTSAGLK